MLFDYQKIPFRIILGIKNLGGALLLETSGPAKPEEGGVLCLPPSPLHAVTKRKKDAETGKRL